MSQTEQFALVNPPLPENALAAPARPGFEVLTQDLFRRTVYLEQRRSERSRRAFLMMLVTPKEERSSSRHQVLTRIVGALEGATRETDVVGWQTTGSTIGVVFSEIEGPDRKQVVENLVSRMKNVVANCLNAEQYGRAQLTFHVFPEDWGELGSDGPTRSAFYQESARDHRSRRVELLLKRVLDVAGSLTALVLLAPLMLAIALLVKLTSEGPILFRQQRVGRFGKRFTFLKFRSMRCSNDQAVHRAYMERFISGSPEAPDPAGAAEPVFKLKNDARVTPIGRFIRRTSVDELPQFLNVLMGEMSLVGPRPPIPYEVDCYQLWHRRRLLAVKPGITGLWQVSGRSSVGFDNMVRLDLKYARTWSLRLDLWILLKTPKAVLTGVGAY